MLSGHESAAGGSTEGSASKHLGEEHSILGEAVDVGGVEDVVSGS